MMVNSLNSFSPPWQRHKEGPKCIQKPLNFLFSISEVLPGEGHTLGSVTLNRSCVTFREVPTQQSPASA